MMKPNRRQALRWTCSSLAMLNAPALLLATEAALHASEPKVVVPSYNTLTDEQEIALGRRFAQQVAQEQQLVDNSLIDAYLSGIVEKLAKVSQRPNLPYSIKLVNTYDVNAFSLAGGFLFLNRGLVQFIDSEDELVATISHEIGHVVGRHAVNRILLQFAAKRVLDTVLANLGTNNGVVEGIINQFGGALAMLALLHFSREDELQADLLGFYETLRAGWDPHGFLKLFLAFQKMEEESGSHTNPYLASHPPPAVRAAAIRQELREVKVPADAITDSLTFQAFKLAMNLLPEPPKHAPER